MLIACLTLSVFSVSGSNYPPGKLPTITPAIELQYNINSDVAINIDANLIIYSASDKLNETTTEKTFNYINVQAEEVSMVLRTCLIYDEQIFNFNDFNPINTKMNYIQINRFVNFTLTRNALPVIGYLC